MNKPDHNWKNKNRKIDFPFVSEHCATIWTKKNGNIYLVRIYDEKINMQFEMILNIQIQILIKTHLQNILKIIMRIIGNY